MHALNLAVLAYAFASFFRLACAITPQNATYIPYDNGDGRVVYLRDFRQPALYSGGFGDCQEGGSLVNIARFDVAFYKDNLTVLFRLAGDTQLEDQEIASTSPDGRAGY